MENPKSMCLVGLLSLGWLYELIVMGIMPYLLKCTANDAVPPDPPLDLSMKQWVDGGRIAVFVLLGVGLGYILVRCCCAGVGVQAGALLGVVLFSLLWHIFAIVWAALGLQIFNNFYASACSAVEDYGSHFNLGFYSEVVVSALNLLPWAVIICCLAASKPEAEETVEQSTRGVPSRSCDSK
jgi:hypothetical protein